MMHSLTRLCFCASNKANGGCTIIRPGQYHAKVHLHKKMYGGKHGVEIEVLQKLQNTQLVTSKCREASKTFFTYFSELLEDHQLSLNQIFNCDEIRLNFHCYQTRH